ncbi:MAG: transcription termination factor NusA [Myxococcota bacterium]
MASETWKLKKVLEQVEKEKGIDRQILIDTIENAVLKAARKHKSLGPNLDLEARYNEEKDEIEVFRWLRVVEDVQDEDREISLEDARKKLDQDCNVKDELGEKIDPSIFGRIAAQTAKQEIIRRVRDAERNLVYEEYKNRKGEVVTGTVRRYEGYGQRQRLIVDLGRAEAVLPKEEQIPKETSVRIGDRIQAYIKEVRNEENKPIVNLSRCDEGFLIKLFETEVPEIGDGIVRIISAARDPGIRAKIAVRSRDQDVDPVGACVGVKGARVQAVVQELRGEKIDIVLFSEDSARFVCNAIAPAQVSRVIIDKDAGIMELVVPDDQLSLAIGRKGQNVRLASKLTGWKLDITSEKEMMAEQEETILHMEEVGGIQRETMTPLFKLGYRSAQDIVRANVEDLAIIPGIGVDKANLLQETAVKVAERMRQKIQPSIKEQPTTPNTTNPVEASTSGAAETTQISTSEATDAHNEAVAAAAQPADQATSNKAAEMNDVVEHDSKAKISNEADTIVNNPEKDSAVATSSEANTTPYTNSKNSAIAVNNETSEHEITSPNSQPQDAPESTS